MDLTLNNVIEIAGQTWATFYHAMPVKMILLLIALLFCFAGYRLMRAVSALSGITLGVIAGICLTSMFGVPMDGLNGLIFTVLVMVVLGLAFGFGFFYWYPLGVFTLCACIGAAVVYLAGLFAGQYAPIAFWLVLMGGAALFGVTGVLFLRPAGIFVTGLFGIGAAVVLVDLFVGQQGMNTLVVGLALTIAGCTVQALTSRGANAFPFGGKYRGRTVIAESRHGGDAYLRVPAFEEDEVDDNTHVLDTSQLPQEEPDEIDSISETVAAHIESTEPLASDPATEAEPLSRENIQETETGPDDTETTEDRAMPSSDVPLEQQAQFAWMTEQPVEASDTDTKPENSVLSGGAWNDILSPEVQALESTADLSQALANVLQASEGDGVDDVQPANDQAVTEQRLSSTADLTHALEQLLNVQKQPAEEKRMEQPMEDGVWEQLFPPVEPEEVEQTAGTESEEAPESSADTAFTESETVGQPEQAEDTAQSEPQEEEPPEPKNVGKTYTARMLWPISLTVVVLVFAGIGITCVELVLTLCFVCYMLRYYRTAAFACAVLCVRRVVDIVLLVMEHGGWQEIALHVLSAGIFLALTYAAMHAYLMLRHADQDEVKQE